MPFRLPAIQIPSFEANVGWNDRSHTLLVLVVRRRLAVAVAVALTMEVSSTCHAPQGVVGTEMSGASISESTPPYLPGSSNSGSPPIN
jgi:hypothetical protein